MPSFNALLLKQKIVLIIMLISGIILLLSSVALIIYDVFSFRQHMVTDLTALARTIAANNSVTLLTEDKKAAGNSLAVLKAKPNISMACIYTTNAIFARYGPTNTVPTVPLTPEPAGHRFSKGRLVVFQPINYEGEAEPIGTFYLESTLNELWRRVGKFSLAVAVIWVGAFFPAFMLSTRFQRIISEPILELTRATRVVSEEKNYSMRAVKRTEDEVGFLIDGFNNMLGQIEKREGALEEANKQLVQSEQKAMAATQAKSAFLANMSHEIRTPLNAILGFSELLAHMVSGSKQRQYLEAISSSGKTLLTLINDILDLSKIEAGKLDLQYEPVSVAQVIAEIQMLFSLKAAEKGIDLQTEVDPSLPCGLILDEVRFRQILFNVVGNALKFTERGHVKIRAGAELDEADETKANLSLEVEDTGIGVPADQQEKIFATFSQVSGQSTRKFGGTGLGLAITKRLTEMMGGTVTVQSQPGGGSMFRFVFPHVAITSPVAGVSQPAGAEGDFAQFLPVTILVADDVELNQALVAGYFAGTAHKLIFAANGREAVTLTRHHRPDLILMDLRMPEMDGYDATAQIKADETLKHIIVVAVTASSFREEEARARKICDGFIRKPFSRSQLVNELKPFLKLNSQGIPAVTPSKAETIPEKTWEAVSADALARRPELLSKLREEQQGVWPELCQTKAMGEIGAFARRLENWAQEGQWSALLAYAASLGQQVDEFDLLRLPQTLQRFPEICDRLTKTSVEI